MQCSIQAMNTKSCYAEKRIEKRFERLERIQYDKQVDTLKFNSKYFFPKLIQNISTNLIGIDKTFRDISRKQETSQTQDRRSPIEYFRAIL